MKYGLFGLNQSTLSNPKTAVKVARAAEEAGFESLWVGEHIVLPDPHVPPSPMPPEEPILDPIVALSYLAAHTQVIRLGIGVIILPQRNPVVLAKELASLDVLSEGRLIFGLGVGYLEPELKAVGVPIEHRGTRTDEYLAAILALWTQAKPEFRGRFVEFSGIQAYPRPVQQPRPPIVVGGRTEFAHRRAIRYADGWYGFNLNVEETTNQLASLRHLTSMTRRGNALGPLEISVTPQSLSVSPAEARGYSDLCVDRLILRLPKDSDVTRIVEFVQTTATALNVKS